MNRFTILSILMIGGFTAFAQNSDSISNYYENSVETLLNDKPGLKIGGYGEVHYNQPINGNKFDSGTLEAHRLVMFLGYNFSKKTQFVSEIEFEYANEIWVEQMFLQHQLNKFANLRAGILLVPMGIINEYHEPTTFNGVERPVIDNRIAPSTWREIGVGLQGNVLQAKTKYQVYLMNGFNGHDGSKAMFSGSKALRDGRQKGSKAYVQKPALTGKLEFYGIKNMNIGLSGYFGESNSRLYSNLQKDNVALVQKADSSVVGISMIGIDTRYSVSGVRLTGQFYYTALSNSGQYNALTKSDLGSSMIGYYVEVGYNVFKPFANLRAELMPFVRYEAYNTHQTVKEPVVKNKNYNNVIITSGLTYTLTRGAVLKADIQFLKSEADHTYKKIFNAGLGVMF